MVHSILEIRLSPAPVIFVPRCNEKILAVKWLERIFSETNFGCSSGVGIKQLCAAQRLQVGHQL